MNSGIAFPVGISINDVAAHFTPSKQNNPIMNKNINDFRTIGGFKTNYNFKTY